MKRFLGARRAAIRYPLNGTAELYLSERELTLRGSLIDISKTGVSFLVATNTNHLMKGELGMLTLDAKDLPDFLTCFVSIIRKIPVPGGLKLGLDFMSIDDDNFAKVSAYLGLARVRATHTNA